jgi:primosomal protein N'
MKTAKEINQVNCTRCGKELGLNYHCDNCDENKLKQFKDACIKGVEKIKIIEENYGGEKHLSIKKSPTQIKQEAKQILEDEFKKINT